MLKYPHIFEPIELAGTIFRNRIFAAPTGISFVDKETHLYDFSTGFMDVSELSGGDNKQN